MESPRTSGIKHAFIRAYIYLMSSIDDGLRKTIPTLNYSNIVTKSLEISKNGNTGSKMREVTAMHALSPQSEPASACLICERTRSEGIHICGQFICHECETEMVHTDVLDEKYSYFVMQMKRVWYKKDA